MSNDHIAEEMRQLEARRLTRVTATLRTLIESGENSSDLYQLGQVSGFRVALALYEGDHAGYVAALERKDVAS